jgi:hypothetical protein
MKCSVASRINTRKMDTPVVEFGAKIIAKLSTSRVDPVDFSEKVKLPTKKTIKEVGNFEKGASYLFSNPKTTTVQGLRGVVDITDKKAMDRLVLAGSNLFKGVADNFFSSKPNTVINPITNESTQLILEGDYNKGVVDSDTKGFLRITSEDLENARAIVNDEFIDLPTKSNGQEHTAEELELYNEGMEFLIVSALYRGYNVVIDDTISDIIIDSALNRYNQHLKPKGIKTQFVSPYRIGKNVVRTYDVANYVNTLSSNKTLTNTNPNSESAFLNSFLTENERKSYKKYKKASKVSKAYVTRRIAKVFNSTIKGVDIKVMDSSEVKDMYGELFASKKGFIVGGSIVLNSDNMTADTLFHEFSHFYMRWLKDHDSAAHAHLLEMVQIEHGKEIKEYTKRYNSTGIKFTSEDILTEIFSDKIGMLAVKDIEDAVEDSSGPLNATVDAYAETFLRKLTRNDIVNSADIDFGVLTSISEMFNIALTHRGDFEQSALYEGDPENQVRLLAEFMIEEPNAKEVFNGLISRGLVTLIKKDTIILTDILGNRYNTKGEIDPTASYKFYNWDTPANVRSNQKFLAEADPYLEKFKSEATVFFSATNPTISTVVNKIKANSSNVSLNEDGTAYVIKHSGGSTTELRRTTQFLGDTFGSGAKGEEYAISFIWSEKINHYKENIASEDDSEKEVDLQAIEWARKFIEEDPAFKVRLEDVMRIFEFKADEGTFLHDLAEFYFRTLQYSNEIDFGSSMKGGYTNFAKPIMEKIALGGTDFTSYIDRLFIANLQNKAGDPDYKSYLESYEKMKSALVKSDRTALFTQSFLEKLNSVVIPVLNKLPGPITIMPEVQLSSKTLGVAGKLDLIVIDGTGRAHIFDYKTKTEGKEFWWDYNSPAKMNGVMKDYSDNAMMKASIQTSIYKLMLMEMGIEVAPSNIFYVANDLVGRKLKPGEKLDDIYYDKNNLEYRPTKIVKKPVIDVSAEMVMHFIKDEKRKLDFVNIVDKSVDLSDTVLKATGGFDIDRSNDIEQDARRAYDRALNAGISDSNQKLQELFRRYKQGALKKKDKLGLTVTLVGNTKFTLPAGIGEEESIALIKEAIMDRKDIKNIEAEFLNRFNKLDRTKTVKDNSERTNDRDQAYRSLLVDVDSTSHEITKMSSNIDYGEDSSGILFIKNKITKGTRIAILNHDYPKNIDFGNDRDNIFGKYISDNKAKMLNPRGSLKASNYNMRLFKIGLIMAQQKLMDPDFSVEVIISNSSFSDRTIPDIHDVSLVLKLTKDMLTIMKEHGETLPASMLELLDNPKVFNSSEYQQNPVDALLEYLSITTGSLVTDNDFFSINSKASERRRDLKRVLERSTGFDNTREILAALREFRHSLSLAKDRSLEAKLHDDLWTLTDQTIMFLNGFNYLVSPKNTDFLVDNFLMTTSKTANMYQTYFNRKITESTTNIREDFIEYKKEHNKLLNDLAASKGMELGRLGSALYTSSRKVIFKNLFAYDNEGERNTAFRLRNPNKPSKITAKGQKPLNKEEIAYLRFFKARAQRFSTMSVMGKKPVVPFGWMPLMRKSNLSNVSDTSAFDRAKASLEKIKKGMSPSGTVKKETPIEEEFTLENKFQGQIPVDASKESENWTKGRQDALGIDDTGQVVDKNLDTSLIEDNLENVLDNFGVASLEAHHYRDVSEFGKSLFYNIKRFENLSGGTSYDQIIKTVALIQKRIIKHQQSGDDSPAFNAINTLATSVVTMGTVTQALLETFTNPLITTATYVADKVYGLMFDGTREFSSASFGKAAKIVWGMESADQALVVEIDNLYGMTNMDTRNLKELLNELEENSLFQTKNLMYVNKLMLENWQKITMVAYMLEQGTFYAHSVDSEGRLVYDEKKDKRFFGDNTTLEKKADKKARYVATKEMLLRQRNGLTGTSDDHIDDRKLNRAWTNYDVNYVKELIVEAYSSMDESSKSLATFYTISKAFFKMRTWLFPKIPRYFQKPMSPEESSGVSQLVKVDAPGTALGYRYEWTGTEQEGIRYTVEYLLRNAGEQKYWIFSKGAWKFKNEHQKKNMSKLLADVGVISILIGAVNGVWAYGLDDDTKKSEVAQLIRNRLLMSASDVFLLKSLLDITTGNGSLFISGAIAVRAVSSALRAATLTPQAIYDDEVGIEELGAAYSTLLKSTIGIYKSGTLIANEIIEE